MSSPTPQIHGTSSDSVRRPYQGSCHCGRIQYIVYLHLPPVPVDMTNMSASGPFPKVQALSRCNCSLCLKTGVLHLQPPNAPEDFLLLSPLDPYSSLSSWKRDGGVDFMFCPSCGVHCFKFLGPSEVVDVDLEQILGSEKAAIAAALLAKNDGEKGNTKVKAWRPDEGSWKPEVGKPSSHLTVNCQTLNAGQGGLDLREWVEKKTILHLDGRNMQDPLQTIMTASYDRPHEGGSY